MKRNRRRNVKRETEIQRDRKRVRESKIAGCKE